MRLKRLGLKHEQGKHVRKHKLKKDNCDGREHLVHERVAGISAVRTLASRIPVQIRWPFYYTHMGETDPVLEDLRDELRFRDLMWRLKAPMDRQRERVLSHTFPLSEEEVQRVLDEVRRDVEGVDYLPE